jgi:hypothetical protein
MVYWETAHTVPDQPQFVLDWARQWQAAEKLDLELVAERRFRKGVVVLRYAVRG